VASGYLHWQDLHLLERLLASLHKGGVGDAYFEDTEALHGYMQPYAALDQADRERVRTAIRAFIAERCVGETVELRTPVLVAIGYRI
jgi:hypothetical protein